MSLTGKPDPSACLHCALGETFKTFHAAHPGYGGQVMVLDILALLSEAICSGLVNTTLDEPTQEQIQARMLKLMTDVVPSYIARDLEFFREAARRRAIQTARRPG